jgi:hypothetical protein
LAEIQTVYQWSHLFNELDLIVGQDRHQQSMKAQSKLDLVFTRILGKPLIKNSDQWLDTSECWICQKHNELSIEMNEFKEINDPEFQEITHLS